MEISDPVGHSESDKRPTFKGLLVLDFSQFLSGPLATLRLADMGARVIKIERPGQGDLGRTLYLSDLDIDGVNTLFHAINRNKESFAADLKNPRDMDKAAAVDCACRRDGSEFPARRDRAAEARLRKCFPIEPAHRIWVNQRVWRSRRVARSSRPGFTGTGALWNHVVERRRRRSAHSIRAGNRRHAYGAQFVPGNSGVPGASRHHGARRARRNEPARIAHRLSV